MRTIVHISDLHFGRVDPAVLDPLVAAVSAARPDVVAVSGDLTQRARIREFEQARDFLKRLPGPQVVVPGNHDVPLYDILHRFATPLRRFRRLITSDPVPLFCDDAIAVVGINTARSMTFKGGRINAQQVADVRSAFSGLPASVLRVVVTHHPFDLPSLADESDVVGRARMAMEVFAQCGVDVFLSGHLHRTHSGSMAERYGIDGYSALVVQAGTATSTRGRGERNAFNVIRIDAGELGIEAWEWEVGCAAFTRAQGASYRRGPSGWQPVPAG